MCEKRGIASIPTLPENPRVVLLETADILRATVPSKNYINKVPGDYTIAPAMTRRTFQGPNRLSLFGIIVPATHIIVCVIKKPFLQVAGWQVPVD